MIKRWTALVVVLTLLVAAGGFAAAEDITLAYGTHSALCGDVDLNQAVETADALEALRIVVGKSTLSQRVYPAADVDGNGEVTATDGLHILQKVVGKRTAFDAGEYATLHLWGAWTMVTPATQDEEGLLRRECGICKEVEEQAIPPVDQTLYEHTRAVLDLVNQERAAVGLLPLDYYVAGQAAADLRAEECNQLFSHTRPDGTDCFTVIKDQVDWYALGENIAMGQTTPAQVVTDWMNSDGHRANILSPNFTHIIVGVAPCTKEGYRGYCWVQLFIGLNQ